MVNINEFTDIKIELRVLNTGKHLSNDIYIHHSVILHLPSIIQKYESLARQIFDENYQSKLNQNLQFTLIKFNLNEPKISYFDYIFCPDFDTNPHPRWQMMMQIGLQDLRVRYKEYDSDYAPVVHCKERLVMKDYPLYKKFAKFSQQEEDWGLLDNWSDI
ncbi:hypothetical protein [Synechocystis sp. PCC 7339]|uniref:hypothetical protein n=1 Tax=Synechocystis sp. PCC 7339 TaxID=2782213 RepID=UPI001CC1B42C|nr:hypothetical protein [Synechocystis sp. PCC 7339]